MYFILQGKRIIFESSNQHNHAKYSDEFVLKAVKLEDIRGVNCLKQVRYFHSQSASYFP